MSSNLVGCQGRFWGLAAHLPPILRRIGLAKMLELALLVLRFLLTRFDTSSVTSGLPTPKIVPGSPLALGIVVAWLSAPLFAQSAEDENLGEAQGLKEVGVSTMKKSVEADHRWRGYVILDERAFKFDPGDARKFGPYAEAGLKIEKKLTDRASVFSEGRLLYDAESHELLGKFDQGGARFRPSPSVSVAVGKERNRRSPGMIVSPSDFIHTNQSLPGARPERSGVWLGRASWQTEEATSDLILLPAESVNDNGMPASHNSYRGTVLRNFRRAPGGLDVSFDIGLFSDHFKLGCFAESIVAYDWKVYGEGGYDQDSESAAVLAGVGYEGSSTYGLKIEYYRRGKAFLPPLPGLLDERYVLASASALEVIDHRFNLTNTLIYSLDHPVYLNVSRAEWLVHDNWVAGATFGFHKPDQPIVWQAMIDAQYSL